MAGRGYGLRDSGGRFGRDPLLRSYDDDIDYEAQRQHTLGGARGAPSDRYTDRHQAGRRLELEDEKDLYIRRQQRQIDDLRDELRMAREREKNPELLQELAASQDQLLEAQRRMSELQRENEHLREGRAAKVNLEITTLQSKISLLEQEVRQREHEIHLRDQRLANMQEQINQEMEQTRRKHEDHMENTRSIRDQHDKMIAALRKDKTEADQTIRQREQELDTVRLELEKQREFSKMLEQELATQRERLDEWHRRTRDLENSLSDRDGKTMSLQAEVAQQEDLIKELKSSLQIMEDMKNSAETREKSVSEAYQVVSDLLGASEGRRQSHLVHTTLREVLDERNRLQHSNLQLQSECEKMQAEMSTQALRVGQLERALAESQERVQRRDHELALVKRDLIAATRELRAAIQQKEHATAELTAVEGRIKTYESEAERLKHTLHVVENDSLRQDDDQSRMWRTELERTKEWHQSVVSSLEARLADATADVKHQTEYTNVCRSLGLLLRIDPDTTPALHAQQIYRAVEELEREVQRLREVERGQDKVHDYGRSLHHSLPGNLHGAMHHMPSAPPYSGNHLHHSQPVPHLGHSQFAAPQYGAPLGQYGAQPAQPAEGEDMAEWLRTMLRRSEERNARLKHQLDAFYRDVARALMFEVKGETLADEALLLARIRKLVEDHPHALDHHGRHQTTTHSSASPSRHTSSSVLARRPPSAKRDRTSPSPHHHPSGHHHPEEFAKMHQRLHLALERHQSLEMWIDVLEKKIEQLDGRSGLNFLEKENETLREQIRNLKLQASGEFRPGALAAAAAAAPYHHAPALNGLSSLPSGREAELERTVASLEQAMAKANDFREQLLRVLDMHGPAVPYHDIILEVQKLKSEVSQLQRKLQSFVGRGRSPRAY